MSLGYMNKYYNVFITILLLLISNGSMAQTANTVVKASQFIGYVKLAEAQFSENKVVQARQSLLLCSELLQDIGDSEIQDLQKDDQFSILFAEYYYLNGIWCLSKGLYQSAESNLLECYKILFKRSDHEKLPLFRSLHLQLGMLYIRLYNIPLALRYLNDAKLGSEINLLFDTMYSRTLIMLSIIYLNQEDYLKAKMYCDEAANTLNNKQQESNKDVYWIYSLLGSCYLEMGYPKDAKRIVLDGILHCKKMYGFDPDLSVLYSALGTVHMKNKDFASAKAIYKKALQLSNTKSKGKYDQLLERSNLAIVQFLTNDLKYKRSVSEMSDIIIKDVIQQFSFLSAEERAQYWEGNSEYLAKFNAMLFLSNDNQYFDQVYENTIFAKGLLLRTSNQISRQLELTTNESLRKDAIQLQKLQKRLINENLQSDELYNVKDSIRQIEKSLAINLVGYQSIDSIRNQYSFQHLKQKLSANEAAVEFIKLPKLIYDSDTVSYYYAAIIFYKNSIHPNIVKLCDEEELYNIQRIPDVIKKSGLTDNMQNELYRQYLYGKGTYMKRRLGKKPIKFACVGDSLYQLIWKPLEIHLNRTSTIYYATSGVLNSIAFNALPVDSISLSNKYLLRYLSSTSEISAIKDTIGEKIGSAVLYGGIDYDTSPEIMESESRGYSHETTRSNFEIDSVYRGMGSSWNFLVGSKKEVEGIANQLTSAHISNKLFTASQANEESLKANSGHSPGLFHIATHGFFYTDARDKGCLDFLHGIKGLKNVTSIQASLSRAGLLFSGANRAWQGRQIDEGIEDGILTAEEVSHLDLSKTNLVILSACETGLGADGDSEGVFGLQRAFKLAGVRTLVMSLWKVPDTETSKLMQLFYTNWLGGMSKYEAFQTAQQEIKKSHPNPYFWAGFVMLD